jgi:pimeloyl-ACP methyl ester carboxylesterase
VWRSYSGLTETSNRSAFVHTVRSVIDPLGQRVSARDRLYLAQEIPTLIVWGERDRIIPVQHAYAAHDLIPGSHLCIVENAGHFLPFERPDLFLEAFTTFMGSTEPAHASEDDFRALLQEHAAEVEHLSS